MYLHKQAYIHTEKSFSFHFKTRVISQKQSFLRFLTNYPQIKIYYFINYTWN